MKMKRLDLLSALTPSAVRQLQISNANRRIAELAIKGIPISEEVFSGLDNLTDADKSELRKEAELLVQELEMPLGASIADEMQKVVSRVDKTIRQLDRDRKITAEDMNMPLFAERLAA